MVSAEQEDCDEEPTVIKVSERCGSTIDIADGLTSVITLMAKESVGVADATNQMEYVPMNVWQPEGRLKTVSILMRKVSQKSNEISVCFNL